MYILTQQITETNGKRNPDEHCNTNEFWRPCGNGIKPDTKEQAYVFMLLRHLEIVNFMGYKQNNSSQEWRSKGEIRS